MLSIELAWRRPALVAATALTVALSVSACGSATKAAADPACVSHAYVASDASASASPTDKGGTCDAGALAAFRDFVNAYSAGDAGKICDLMSPVLKSAMPSAGSGCAETMKSAMPTPAASDKAALAKLRVRSVGVKDNGDIVVDNSDLVDDKGNPPSVALDIGAITLTKVNDKWYLSSEQE